MKTWPRHSIRPVCIALGLLLLPLAQAQTIIEPPLVNPGARSLGLGGAFVAVADDATAAWVNPAGLMQLVRPEVSLELRVWNDDRTGVASDLSSLGFGAFVLPRDRWAIAIYGQSLASLDFPDSGWTGGNGIDLMSSLIIANGGVSTAFRVSDSVSVGVGATFSTGSLTEGYLDEGSFVPNWDDDTRSKAGLLGGLLWQLDDSWAVGASYRSGADLRFRSGARADLPDILAAGARWRAASGKFTVAGEIEQFSGLDDRVRFHLGGEWAFLSVKPLIGLRAGLWYDPEGGITTVDVSDVPPPDDGVLHASIGLGVAWNRFLLDVAADISTDTRILSISGIYTF